MKCESVQELISPYVLGALEPRERRRLERHIAGCPGCAEALREALEASVPLASVYPAVQPSGHVRTALMKIVRESMEAARKTAQLWPGFRWRGALTAGLGAASLALLVISVLLITRVESMDDQVAAIQTSQFVNEENINALNRAVQQQRSLAYTLAIPGTNVVMGTGSGGFSSARGVLMSSADGSWGLLVSTGLQELPPNKAYQVWLTGREDRESAGMFKVDDSGWGQVTLRPHRRLSLFHSVGVTVEPVEGSPAPTGPMVLEAEMGK